MENVKDARAGVTISWLDPHEVDLGWEGTVNVHGTGFDNNTYAFFDGSGPVVISRTAILLVVDVKNNITGTAGTKVVKAHTGSGGLSNPVDFVVKPKEPSRAK